MPGTNSEVGCPTVSDKSSSKHDTDDGTWATARQRLFPEGWEEMKNRMKENGSNQEISPAERGGRTYPETRNALSKQSAGGGRGRTRDG
ncbi:hypothetical protein TNCV_741091 [Trichonephila clavipes]|nr:hypothetical protein TNCV_741091 [Trichonephila clavipes]